MGNLPSTASQCVAKFKGDPDIAGPGVMAAFLVTGWLTFGVAAIVSGQKGMEDYRALIKRNMERKLSRDIEMQRQPDIPMQQETGAAPLASLEDYRALIKRNIERKLSRDIGMQDQSESITPDRAVEFASFTRYECAAARQRHPYGRMRQETGAAPLAYLEEIELCWRKVCQIIILVFICVGNFFSRWSKSARAGLAPLCDLQVVTGTAMLVAGFAQGNKLTYYHELIITSYWNITLNSFWAAQIGNSKYEHINDLASTVRNVTVLGSTVLSIIFQIRFNDHIFSHWQPETSGRCYTVSPDGNDRRQAVLWVVGLSIYAAVLAARILGLRDEFFDRFSFNEVDQEILKYFKGREQDEGNRTPFFELICRALAFLLTSFVTVWSFGSTSFGIETLAILGYLSWNTLDVIGAKVSNLPLVDPPETSWGFGQVLPMALLGTILLGTLEVYEDDKEEQKGVKVAENWSEKVIHAY